MDALEKYQEKLITVDEMLDLIKPGNRIFLSSGPAMPVLSVTEITSSDRHNLQDLEIIQLITLGDYLSSSSDVDSNYRLKTFNIGESISKELLQGKIDFIPANMFEIPIVLGSGAVGVDVAIVTTSSLTPDKSGFLSLGNAVDVANIVISNAPVVIAEVNPNMPHTYGEALVHLDQIDYIIESDKPILVRDLKGFDEAQDQIGWHISNLISDGSTVVLHAGSTFDAIAHNLKGKKNLGVYTNVISDWVIGLIESGAISFDRRRAQGGFVTTSYCYGTKELYEYVDKNPIFEFYPTERLANPFTIRRINNLVSIMNVKKIDVSGESVIFHSGDSLLSGYESKMNFAFGAAFSVNGKAIVTLRSTDLDGTSNIVISHEKNRAQVRATLGFARYVVTEYGVANLFGKSIRERVMAMIEIANPKHREELLESAKECGYAYQDQIYNMENALNYPIDLETVNIFKGFLEVKIRPIKPSDEEMMRRLFYHFSDESKYLRYFANISAMPHREMQKYVNIDYNKSLSIVGVIQRLGTERIIAEARYSSGSKGKVYEMAFIVDEEFQGRGLATYMANYLLMIATKRGLKKLCATVLAENKKMLRVFDKTEYEYKTKYSNGVVEVTFKLKS